MIFPKYGKFQFVYIAVTLLATAFLTGCSGGSGGSAGTPPPITTLPPVQPVAATFPDKAITKVRTTANSWVALAERLRPLEDFTRPDRQLLIAADGQNVTTVFSPPPRENESVPADIPAWTLVDFTLHGSGEISTVLANDRELRLLRLDLSGKVLREFAFADSLVATDPYMGGEFNWTTFNASMVSRGTRDAVRVSAIGEDMVVALRSGRGTVLAYRFNYSAAHGFLQQWRTVVEPGVGIGFLGITSGTFDPFGSLENHWKVFLDTDVAGRIAIAVSPRLTGIAEGHTQYFGEVVDPDLWCGALVTRLSPNGQRLGTAILATEKKMSELHGLRWIGETVALTGRIKQDGGNWDAYISLVGQDSNKPVTYQVADVEQGDIFFDVASLSNGQLVVAGAAGYTQNPSGGSISEAATPLLAVLDKEGKVQQRIPVPAGPRHNQLRSLAPWKGNWLIGGLQNGPGTHSADAGNGYVNMELLRADGWVRETIVPH